MQFDNQREGGFVLTAALQPKTVDEGDVPEWPVPFQGCFQNLGRQGHEAGLSPLITEIHVGEVALNAELRVIDPVRAPALRWVADFHDDPGYIGALATRVNAHWAAHGRGERLLMSFHGLPQRNVDRGDPYAAQCQRTAQLLAQALELQPTDWALAFQSRFGRARWLEPATDATLRAWGGQGMSRVDVICPGFVADCLETLEEIAIGGRQLFESAGGGELRYIAALNDAHEWLTALAARVQAELAGWPDGVATGDST